MPLLAVPAVMLLVSVAEPPVEAATPLAKAVEEFNAKAAKNATGRTQPPWTEDEVVAAIRGWVRSKRKASDAVYAAYQRIASDRSLPPGAALRFTTSWVGYKGYKFDVWWIDLSIRTGKGTGYTFRIRDRKLRVRPLTEEERKRLRGFP